MADFKSGNTGVTLLLLIMVGMGLGLTTAVQAANMSLNKHRIILDEKHLRDDLLVYNPTSDFQSYRVTVEDFTMDQQGQIRRSNGFAASARSMLRVGPRLGRNIAPNNSQKFRVMLKKRNLPDGEYRSHILIEALLPPLPDAGEGITIRPNIKYSIPVIVRKGQLSAELDITTAKLTLDESDNKVYLHTEFVRSGQRSVYGNLKAYLKSQPQQLLFAANGIAIYPEINTRVVRLPLTGQQPGSGILVIEFAENPQYGGDLTAHYELQLLEPVRE